MQEMKRRVVKLLTIRHWLNFYSVTKVNWRYSYTINCLIVNETNVKRSSKEKVHLLIFSYLSILNWVVMAPLEFLHNSIAVYYKYILILIISAFLPSVFFKKICFNPYSSLNKISIIIIVKSTNIRILHNIRFPFY